MYASKRTPECVFPHCHHFPLSKDCQAEGKTVQSKICSLEFSPAKDVLQQVLSKLQLNYQVEDLLKEQTFSNGEIGKSCMFHWSFTKNSLWSGEAEAWKLASLSKSMLHKGCMTFMSVCELYFPVKSNFEVFTDAAVLLYIHSVFKLKLIPPFQCIVVQSMKWQLPSQLA